MNLYFVNGIIKFSSLSVICYTEIPGTCYNYRRTHVHPVLVFHNTVRKRKNDKQEFDGGNFYGTVNDVAAH